MDLAKFQNLDIVLVCGLPGSGKSHFARTFFLKSGRKRTVQRRCGLSVRCRRIRWKMGFVAEHGFSRAECVDSPAGFSP